VTVTSFFAEAFAAFRAKAQWWPDAKFEREHIKPEQEARYEADPWEEAIANHVLGRSRVTVSEVARDALGFETTGRIGTADQRRIAGVLASKGWTPRRDHDGRFYSPPRAP
jgi:predicted P-loop ATPase